MTNAPVTADGTLIASILDLSADAILTVGPDERILSWNRGATEMFGWTADEIVGRHFAILLPEEELARGELDWIHRATAAQGSIRDHETRRKAKDGRILEVSLTRTAVFDDAGRLVGFSAILRDISERKRLAEQMLMAERLATAGQVATGVAHEIGAPLTAIAVAVDHMLRTRCIQCAGAEEMRVLLSQTDRIAKLARRLVNLAKPAGLIFSSTPVNEVATQAARLVRTQLRHHGVRLSLDLAPEVPPVRGDEAQLQQVLINLLLNAQQAMGDRGGSVRIITRLAGPDAIEIVVADDGPGIAESDLPHLFTPFFSRAGGTGLGLALAAQIVKAHAGSIEAESRPAQGATFTIRLPAAGRVG